MATTPTSPGSSDMEVISETDVLMSGRPRRSNRNGSLPVGSGVNPNRSRWGASRPHYGTYPSDTGMEVALPMDNPVTVALHMCNKMVLKPYKRLLLAVGWQPIFENPTACWQHTLNIIHPMFVICLILIGYVIQYAACFRRDSAGNAIVSWSIVTPINRTNSSLNGQPDCHSFLISQYIIPDLLHSVAYAYSFYLLRIADSEHLTTLVERVFLQTSPTQTGFLSQGKLIKTMRVLLLLGVLWVLLSIAAQAIHIVAQYPAISLTWMASTNIASTVALLVMMMLGFFSLDLVYTAVVINYCVQCLLLVFYIEGLQEKIRQKSFELKRAMKEIAEVEKHLGHLNYNTAIALSIVLFNFGTMAFLGAIRLFDVDVGYSTLMYISTALSVIFWFSIMTVPVIQAARLSAACNSLRKVGHEIRIKPFVYQDVADDELNSFLIYTSALNMKAKLFLVPIKTSYLSGVVIMVCFIMLLLFQTGALRIWL